MKTELREHLHRDSADTRWGLQQLNIKKSQIWLVVVFGVLAIGSGTTLLGVSAWLIARAAQMPHISAISLAVVAVRGLGITRGVMRYVERLAGHRIALRSMTGVRTRIYATLAEAPLTYVTRLSRGQFLREVGKDVEAMGAIVVRCVVPFLVAAVIGLSSVVVMATLSIPAAIVLAIALVVATVLVPLAVAAGVRAAEVAASQSQGAVSAGVQRVVDARAEWEVAGVLAGQLATIARHDAAAVVQSNNTVRVRAWSFAAATAVQGIAVIGAVWFGSQQVAAGDWSLPWFAVVALLPLAAFEAATLLPAAATDFATSAAATRRLKQLLALSTDSHTTTGRPDVLQQPADPAIAPDPAALHDSAQSGVTATMPNAEAPSTNLPDAELTSLVSLRTHQLVCGWPGAPSLAADDVQLRTGDIVTVEGPSGSGKTTWLLTLAGLLPPQSGDVRWSSAASSCSAQDVQPQAARSLATLCTEDAHIFNTSIRENVRLAAGDISDVKVSDALRAVGLETWLATHPAGLDHVLPGGAEGLSGGERRRLLLARALATSATLILCDEPTEHVDDQGVEDIARLLRRTAARGRIVVVATHDSGFAASLSPTVQLGIDGSSLRRVLTR